MIAVEAERVVLGALLTTDAGFYAASTELRLRDGDFGDNRHAAIYRAMQTAADNDGGFDRLAILAALEAQQFGWARELVHDLGAAPRLSDFRRALAIVKAGALDRAAKQALHEFANGEGDARQRVERAALALADALDDTATRSARRIGDILGQVVGDLDQLGDQEITGVPSGFSAVDKLTGGWQPGHLIVLGARPAMGKSAFALQCAVNAAREGVPTYLATMEMEGEEVGQRVVAQRSHISADSMRRGPVKDSTIRKAMETANAYSDLPLWVDDLTDMSAQDLKARVRRLAQREGLGLVVVDYLQLMRMPKAENKNQAVSELSRGLKVLAGELRLPVIALSQLSRKVEERGNSAMAKRPQLHDLRESGSIEQDANLVLMLFREDYYDPEGAEHPGMCEVIVPKHRGGPKTVRENEILLPFDGPSMRFYNPSPHSGNLA